MEHEALLEYLNTVYALEKEVFNDEKIRQLYEEKLLCTGIPRKREILFHDTDMKHAPKTYVEKSISPFELIFKSRTQKNIDLEELLTSEDFALYQLSENLPAHSPERTAIFEKLKETKYDGYKTRTDWKKTAEYKDILNRNKFFKSKRDNELRKFYTRMYEAELEEIAEKEQPIRKCLQRDLTQKIHPITEEAKALLEKIYALDIISAKYRNFLTISQLYEYCKDGRCISLEGSDGAYHLFEKELQQNRITDSLTSATDPLEPFGKSMQVLASAVSEANTLLDKISATLYNHESSPDLTAYHTSCVKYHAEIADKFKLD